MRQLYIHVTIHKSKPLYGASAHTEQQAIKAPQNDYCKTIQTSKHKLSVFNY